MPFECKKCYIGETSRPLDITLNEHKNYKDSCKNLHAYDSGLNVIIPVFVLKTETEEFPKRKPHSKFIIIDNILMLQKQHGKKTFSFLFGYVNDILRLIM